MVDFQETLYYRSSHIKTKYLSSGAGHVVMFSRVAELITETCWTGFYRTSQWGEVSLVYLSFVLSYFKFYVLSVLNGQHGSICLHMHHMILCMSKFSSNWTFSKIKVIFQNIDFIVFKAKQWSCCKYAMDRSKVCLFFIR
jgi:hypothetical protein